MYVAIELKTKVDGSFEVSTYKKNDRDDAEKAYHSILAGAATSEHPVHAAVILNEYGATLRSEYYKHEVPEPNPDENTNDKEGE